MMVTSKKCLKFKNISTLSNSLFNCNSKASKFNNNKKIFITNNNDTLVDVKLFPSAIKIDHSKLSNIFRSGIKKSVLDRISVNEGNIKKVHKKNTQSNSIVPFRQTFEDIINHDLTKVVKSYKNLQNQTQRLNKNHLDSICKELKSINNNFHLSQHFSKSYRACNDVNLVKKIKIKQDIENNIVRNAKKKNVKMFNFIKIELTSCHYNSKFKKLQKIMITAAMHFMRLNITLNEVNK